MKRPIKIKQGKEAISTMTFNEGISPAIYFVKKEVNKKLEEEYKLLLKQYKISDAKIGRLFGYKTRQSWHDAYRREKVMEGIIGLIKLVSAIENIKVNLQNELSKYKEKEMTPKLKKELKKNSH